MNNYKRINVSQEKYNHCVITQIKNGTPFREHQYGSRRKLIINNKLSATSSPTTKLDLGDLSESKFIGFLATFTKQLYKRLMSDEKLLTMKIEYKGIAKSRNIDFWDSIPVGRAFYNIDCSSAYWQILRRLNYISNDMYEKYRSDVYKKAKRYCVTFLARKNKMNYIYPDKHYTIHCDTSCLQNVYNNVRYELYKCIANVVSLTDDQYIEFNIDGITVLGDMVDKVKVGFINLDLEYKTTRCTKINDYQYKYGSTIRNFKNKGI